MKVEVNVPRTWAYVVLIGLLLGSGMFAFVAANHVPAIAAPTPGHTLSQIAGVPSADCAQGQVLTLKDHQFACVAAGGTTTEAGKDALGPADWDSGWRRDWTVVNTADSERYFLTLSHGLNTEDTLVYIEGKDSSQGYSTFGVDNGNGIHQYRIGLDDSSGDHQYGAYWYNKNANSITIWRGDDDLLWDQVRVRMWRIDTSPALPKVPALWKGAAGCGGGLVLQDYCYPLACKDSSGNQKFLTCDTRACSSNLGPPDGKCTGLQQF